MMNFAPAAVAYFTYYFLIPESPRWLHRQGRTSEGIKVLERMAKVNGSSIDKAASESLLNVKKETDDLSERSEGILDIFKYPRVLARYLTCVLAL